MAARGKTTAVARCAQCNDHIFFSDRQRRRKLQEGRPNICTFCRAINVKPPDQRHINYWLDRFTLEEIREMGQAIWG